MLTRQKPARTFKIKGKTYYIMANYTLVDEEGFPIGDEPFVKLPSQKAVKEYIEYEQELKRTFGTNPKEERI